jgi:hypothetical protein
MNVTIQPTKAIPTISLDPNQPSLPTDMPLDPHNPLIWIIVITALISATEKPLNAIANLLRVLKRPK